MSLRSSYLLTEHLPQTTVSERSVDQDEPIRINRFIALCGKSSRRGADELIEEGRVQVNGEQLSSDDFGLKVTAEDVVRVDGERISPHPFFYILLNKPKDTITTTDDERGRTTVLDLIDDEDAQEAGIFPVGRLDRNTAGLLILTNDGVLANRLMHPRYEMEKRYRVRTKEPVSVEALERLRSGVPLEDGPAAADRVTRSNQSEYELYLDIHEGRNRQVRRMMAAIGHDVVDLVRTQYAGLTLDGVPRGDWRWLDEAEIQRLEQQVDVR